MHKIVIIEGDESLRLYLQAKFLSLGFNVFPCRDGFEGIIKIKNELPDLIILNLDIERLSAFQLLKEKIDYKTTTNIPVLVIASQNKIETNAKLTKLKVNKILIKPLKIDTLWEYVYELFKMKQKVDTTPSKIDIHLNDDILFVEISNGLNIEKLEVITYKINHIVSNYQNHIPKALIILTHIEPQESDIAKLNYLISNIIAETNMSSKGIKILSPLERFATIINKTKYPEVELCTDFNQAVDALGKIDIFTFGDEIDEIKSKLLSNVAPISEINFAIETEFSNEKNMIKDDYTIAIIDDDLHVLEFMGTALHRENWTINTYESAKAFIRDLPIKKPDLIFLDLMMPETNGFQLAQFLLERNISIPIVVVTALSQKEMVFEARKFGITNFLTKPFTSEAITAKAEELLRNLN